MADTYEAFYNGKPLNPNRGLPTMSYAQAEDCGLTDSERLWCRTDGQNTPINASQVEGRLVKTIPANTFSTYALALADLETAYDSLSENEKRKSVIFRNQSYMFKINAISEKIFNYTLTTDTLFMNQTFNLLGHKWFVYNTNSSPTISDNSESAQSQQLDLYII